MTTATLGIALSGIDGFDRGAAALEKFTSMSKKAESAAAGLVAKGEQAAASVGKIFGADTGASRFAQQIDKSNQSLRGFEATAARAAAEAQHLAMQIDQMTSRDIRDADIQAFGQEMDQLRAKFVPLFAASKAYENELNEINRAHAVGAISAMEQAAAIASLDDRYTQAAGAANLLASANDRMGRSAGQARMMNQQLMYQMVDMGQALPLLLTGNIWGLQNMGFQIAQIGQLYYGNGGMGAALKDMSTMLGGALLRIAPLAAGIGVVAAAFAGLTYEFNKTAEVQVSFFDVALAGWQLLAEGIGSAVSPIFGWIADRFQQLWDWLAPIIKGIGNTIIGSFVGSYDAIVGVWGKLPAAIGDVVYSAAQNSIDGIIYLIREAQVQMNDFLTDLDGLMVKLNAPMRFGTIKLMQYVDLKNPFPGAAGAAGDAAQTAFGAAQQDYLGMAGDVWSKRAQEIAAARGEVDELGSSARAANDNFRSLGDTITNTFSEMYNFGRDVFTGFFADMKSGLKEGQSFWESLGNAGLNALDKIASKALDMATNGIWDMIFGAVMGGLGGNSLGGGWGVAGGFGRPGIFGIPGMADGGTVGRAGLSWVGERGPELLRLPQGAQVIPNGPSMAMAANANNSNDNRPITLRLVMPDGWRAEILEEAGSNAVRIVQANDEARNSYYMAGGNPR